MAGPFRNEIVTGVGEKQILLEDPCGNPIELFEPMQPRGPAAAELRRRAVPP